MDFDQLTPDSLIRREEVERHTGLKRSTLYRKIGDGSFPRPVRLTEKSVAWRWGDVVAWNRSRVEASEAAA